MSNWIDPESYDSPLSHSQTMNKFGVMSVDSLERLLCSVSGDVPVFMSTELEEEELDSILPVIGLYVAYEPASDPSELKWERLTIATDTDDIVAVMIRS